MSVIRTRDIDFLVSLETKFEEKVNLPKMLEAIHYCGLVNNYFL